MKEIGIVGSSLAGLRTAEALRDRGVDARITLIGEESHLPYDRPPLSKEILTGKWDAEKTLLRREGLESLELDLRLGTRALACDASARTVTLADDSRLTFDALVLATGARARRLPGQPELTGLFTLRTLEDALALRAALTRGTPRVAVLGAGFIGAEVAASARSLGLEVTLVEAAALPMERLLPRAIGETVAALHRDQGVALRLAAKVEGFVGEQRVEGLRLAGGETLAADIVVVGIGATPATAWLEGSGLRLEDGVVCDERCRAAEGIVAVGDCARWKSRRYGELLRIEHWTNAVDQAVAAAATLVEGDAAPAYDPVPYAWSDQYGIKIQVAGRPAAADRVHIVHGDPADLRFVALFERGGRLSGCVGFRRPRFVMEYLGLLERGTSIQGALAAGASF